MSVRLPLQAILSYSDNYTGSQSVSGGIAQPFNLPQDTDGVVVKMVASTAGAGGMSAVLQTSDDGGTTWWDVARTSIVTNAVGLNAEWLAVPTFGLGINSNSLSYSSAAGGTNVTTVFNTTGNSAAASSLGARQYSGLPILSQYNRIFMRYGASVNSVIGTNVTVYVNQQAPRS